MPRERAPLTLSADELRVLLDALAAFEDVAEESVHVYRSKPASYLADYDSLTQKARSLA